MMVHPAITTIEQRASVNLFDPSRSLSDSGASRIARYDAVRSASLAAATPIFAAEGLGFASESMGRFDADDAAREFGLEPDEATVMLVAVGRAAPGNGPQKPRRAIAEVLEFS